MSWNTRCSIGAPSESSEMMAKNRTASDLIMLPAGPEYFPTNEKKNSPKSLDSIGERGRKGKMIFLRLH